MEYEIITRKTVIKKMIIFSIFLLSLLSGSLLNDIAVNNNDCKMPVKSTYYFSTDSHFGFLDDQEVHYYYLTDIIQIKNIVISIGDILIVVGGIGLIFLYITESYFLYANKQIERFI